MFISLKALRIVIFYAFRCHRSTKAKMYLRFLGIGKYSIAMKTAPDAGRIRRTPRHNKGVVVARFRRMSCVPANRTTLALIAFLPFGIVEGLDCLVIIPVGKASPVNDARLAWEAICVRCNHGSFFLFFDFYHL